MPHLLRWFLPVLLLIGAGIGQLRAQCTLDITRVEVSGCYYSGGQSLATVSVEVAWANPPAGNINVQLGAVTRTITPGGSGGKIISPQVVAFEIPANGAAGIVTAAFVNNPACDDSENFNAPVACPPNPCPGSAGTVGGKAYVDYNQDGVKQSGETSGQSNVEVRIYACNANGTSVFVNSTTTDGNGDYYFSGLTNGTKYRVEFVLSSGLVAQGYRLGNNGTDSRTSVQFVTAPTCTSNIGVFIPGDYCEANPTVLIPCFTRGNPLVAGDAADDPALIAFPYNASGTAMSKTVHAVQSQVGSLWGMAYDKYHKRMYSASFLRRHTGLGPHGLYGIYMTDMTAPPATSTSLFLDLSTLGVNLGTISSNAARGLVGNKTTPNVDAEAFGKVGKVGMGDIDINENGDTLFFINLFTRRLQSLRLDDDGNPNTPYTHVASDVDEYDFSSVISCSGGEMRPWGLKYRNGKVYIGAVCDAQSSNNRSDLRAYIIEFTPGPNTFSILFDFPLTYPKGSPFSSVNDRTGWYPWTDTWSTMTSISGNGGTDIGYPSPILCDIEFDIDGSMVLGFGDRAAYQLGFDDWAPTGAGSLYRGFAGGDILRVFAKDGSYVLENNAKAGPSTGFAANNNQGPGFGEFYNDIWNNGGHSEIMLGGLALRPGSGQVMAVMMDPLLLIGNPAVIWSNGVRTLSNQTGAYVNGFVIFQRSDTDPGTFGKAAGLGDIELVCSVPTQIQIGNRIWNDKNKDGVQDPCEDPIANVKVELYDRNGNLVGSATTNANGEYYFDQTNVDTIAPYGTGGFTGMSPNTPYYIVVGKGMSQFNTTLSELNIGSTFYKLTPAANTGQSPNDDMNDSDAQLLSGLTGGLAALNGFPGFLIVSPGPGDVNHTYDAGFYQDIDFGDLPDNNAAGSYPTNLTNGAGEGVGPSHVITLSLKLGAAVDAENDGQPTANADGDDSNGTPDDEDGVTLPDFLPGQVANITVSVMNTTGSVAKLTGFFDWNNDKDFNDANEMVSVNVPNGTMGDVTLTVTVPVNAVVNANIGLRFRISTDATASMSPTGAAPNGEVEDYIAQVRGYDWGDLPDTGVGTGMGNYQTTAADNGPNHAFVNGLKMGATIDFEQNGQQSANADGDDNNGTPDDEDGIAAFPTFIPGQTATINVSVMNMTANPAVLSAFFDWNKDGDFLDPNEQSFVGVPAGFSGTVQINATVPANAIINMPLGARFRLSTNAAAVASAFGPAPDGEIEDYLITVIGYDYGDLADNDAPGSYPTNNTNGGEGIGPCHQIVPGLKIGALADNELDGQPSTNANGDDLNGLDDEDGIATFPVFTAGLNANITVSVMNMMAPGAAATLYGFIDWNKDGDFNDLNETAMVTVPNGTNGNVILTFTVPVNAVLNMPLGARFRLSTQAGLGATGCAPDGEVEDYYIQATGIDYGDLPDNNGPGSYPTDNTNGSGEGIGPCHTIVTGLKLGSSVTPEAAAQPSAMANGDDNDGTDDEDGIASFPMFATGQTATVSVFVMNMLPNNASATLYGFFDWNKDGDFNDANEALSVVVPNGVNGLVNLTVNVPPTAVPNMPLGARFRISTVSNLLATGCAPDGEVEDYLIQVSAVDYGDLPDNNGPGSYPTDNTNGAGEGIGPCHTIVTGLKIGANVDGEPSATPTAGANGDDNNNLDDEDGIAMFPMFYAGQTATVPVTVMNMLPGGLTATLYGFIDWNQDGDFDDAEETVSAFVANGTNGPVNLVFNVPLNAVINSPIGARFRISTVDNLGPTGCAPDGEVEDYMVMAGALDFGDLPDNDQPGSYPTNITNGAGEGVGPCHAIVAGLKIGALVDPEGAALPSANADGDDNNPFGGPDDEDGVAAFPMFLAGQNTTVSVSVMNMMTPGANAFLYGFADWNKDGDFLDAGESVVVPVPDGTNGTVNVVFNVPANAVLNMNLGMRFRLSTDAGLGATGCATNGEVEDYLVQVMAFDYGDLPDNNLTGSYPTNAVNGAGEGIGPSHKIVVGLKMGNAIDFETDGQPSANANGDDNNGTPDDEDGIAAFPTFEAGTPATIQISVMNMVGDAAVLYGFFDWNKDGDFNDPNEKYSVTVPNGFNGMIPMNVNVPANAVLNMPLGARFRLSTDMVAASTPEGPAPDGEVEDYLVSVLAYDYGDLPDNNTANSFPTNNFNGGEGAPAKHRIIETLRLGVYIDAEIDGNPSAQADGDDNSLSPDDEDGIVFATPLIPGYQACVRVTAVNTTGSTTYLQAWMDFNGNGQFDAGEKLTTGDFAPAAGASVPNGGVVDQAYCFTVPANATFNGGQVAVRFRLSSEGSLDYFGTANTGEVEDYIVPLAKVGNLVWEDYNGDGIQNEPGSAGINGVTVQLVYAGPDGNINTPGDNLTYTATTSIMTVDGQYMFPGLIPGNYRVSVPTTPAGHAITTINATTSMVDSDNPAGVLFSIPDPILLPFGENGTGDVPGLVFPDANDNLTFDFGYYRPAAIGNFVFMDNDDSGTFNAGDMAIPLVAVHLYNAGADYGVDAPLQTTTTNGNGYYYFDNLRPGQYVVYIPAVNFNAGQPLFNKESVPGADNGQTVDNNDNGIDTKENGGIASNVINLSEADQPTGENQVDYPGTLVDNRVNATIDFGFRVEKVAVGNHVFMDNDDSGTFNNGDMAIPNVLVWLYPAGANYGVDLPLATDVTDPSGYYYFDQLNAGDYVIFIPAINFAPGGALINKESVPGADASTTDDNNDNGQDAKVVGGIRSNQFTLTPNAMPVNEGGAGGSGTGTPAYPGLLDDDNVNETIDFGFRVEKVAIGNFVFMDTNDNGTYQAGTDMPVPDVAVWLYPAGADYGVDLPLLTTTTNNDGYYYFDQLNAGQYVVYIPAVNFGVGQPLFNKESTPGADGGQTIDNNDNGIDTPVNGGIVSNVIDLQPNSQPTGENQTDYPGILDDDNVNGTVDFGFRIEKVAVGNLVFMDNNNDGVYNVGDMPVPFVTVWLYPAGANYGIDPPLKTDVTNGLGHYYFDQLNAGDYVVYIPASNFLLNAALDSKESVPGANTNNTDNDDNGQDILANNGVRSNVFTLTPNAMPTNEPGAGGAGTGTPAYPGLLDDDNVNETIDFGFRCVNPLPDIIADITVNTDPGVCTAVVTYNVNIVTTPSGNLTVTYEFTGATTGSGNGTGSGSTFNLGETTITITATNACTTVVQVFKITVIDEEPPVITCPPNVTVQCMPMNQNATATDNCSVESVELLSMVYLDPPAMCVTGRRLRRTFIATDGSGNTATCSHQITLVDNIAPTFTFVPANVTVQCNSVPVPGTPVATDNCVGQVTITYNGETRTNGACVDSYVLLRQWTASDACGNTRTATQRINVIDTQKPAFVNPPANITVQCDAIPPATAPLATDNCDADVAITFVGETRTNGSCVNAYTLTRRWVASDNCNNTVSISQRITVVDNGKPVFTAVPANVTINCNQTIPSVGAATASDGCGGTVTVVYVGAWNMAANCPGSYQIMRTWKATDACGNSTTAAQIITIQDNTPPTFVSFPNNVTIQCNQSVPALTNPTASDGCGGYVQITYLGQVRTDGNCLYNYTLTRTWRATDLCGNSTTRAQVIAVQDTQLPNFTGSLPANTTVICAPNCVPLPPVISATDNCGSATVTLQQNQTAGDCTTGYTVTRTWTATDQCGNARQHTQVYTVLAAPFAPPAADRDQEQLETQHSKLKTITLLPNPTTDWVSIGLGDFAGEAVVASIHDELGRLVWEQHIPAVEESVLRVNLRQAGASAGLYAVSVRSGGQVYSKRLVLIE